VLVVSSFSGVVGHRADNKLTYEMELGLEQTTKVWGVCESALKPHQTGKAQGRKAKTPNRTLGNPAVRERVQEKASVFSESQSHQGKSQRPCSSDGREEGNQISEAHRQSHL